MFTGMEVDAAGESSVVSTNKNQPTPSGGEILVKNLPSNISIDDLQQFFGLNSPQRKNSCVITLEVGDQDGIPVNTAKVVSPEEIRVEVLKLNGAEFNGRPLEIVESVSEDTPAGSASNQQDNVYVEIDVTACLNCYEVAGIKNAQIVHAVELQFPADNSRRLRALKGQNNGKWRLSSKNPNLYKDIDFLLYRGQKLGVVRLVTEERVVNLQGEIRFVRKRDDRVNGVGVTDDRDAELLITLVGADEPRFEHVSDEELIERIVNMGVGNIKIPVRQQTFKGTSEYTGNKYFVLKDLKPGDKEKLSDHFDFFDEVKGGMGRMWLSWFGKRRSCFHCKKIHEGECPLMVLASKLQEERDSEKSKNNNILPIKTYANSELRRVSQNSLMSDVDCMSGGSTGNILNAMEIDPHPSPIAVVVAGQNELRRTMDTDEFLWILAKSGERLATLAKDRKMLLIPPPIENSMLSEPKIREEFFHEHLGKLNMIENIQVVDNPLDEYSDDGGQHPSRAETEVLVRYIDEQTRKFYGTPYILPSATSESLASTDLYSNVTGLYKYGCSGCSSKARNKWYNLCTECRSAVQEDADIRKQIEEFEERVEQFLLANNPDLQQQTVGSPEVLSCPHCDTEFVSGEQIRNHFKDNHPEASVPEAGKDLRVKHKYDDVRNRRDKVFKP